MATKQTFLRHLVTNQENHQSWKQILYKNENDANQLFFSSRNNCHILYFIKVHGIFLHLGVLNIDLQADKHHRLNISRKTWSTHIVVKTTSTEVETLLKHIDLPKMTSRHSWYTIMSHSGWTITRFTAYTYTKTHASAWLFNSPSSTNIST